MDVIDQAAKMASDWWAARLMQGDKDAFSAFISMRVAKELRKLPVSDAATVGVELECDYDPKGILLEAVRHIGIDCRGYMFSGQGILPQKHALRVTTVELIPKEGYGNWTDKIPVPNKSVSGSPRAASTEDSMVGGDL